jgi:hypothetical protein
VLGLGWRSPRPAGHLVGEATEHEEAEHRQDHRQEQRHRAYVLANTPAL